MAKMERAIESGMGLLTGAWPFSEMKAGSGPGEDPAPPAAALPKKMAWERMARTIMTAVAKARRAGGLQEAAALKIEARVALGPKKSIALIACHGRHFLVASAGEQIAPLVEVLPLSSVAMCRAGGQENEASR